MWTSRIRFAGRSPNSYAVVTHRGADLTLKPASPSIRYSALNQPITTGAAHSCVTKPPTRLFGTFVHLQLQFTASLPTNKYATIRYGDAKSRYTNEGIPPLNAMRRLNPPPNCLVPSSAEPSVVDADLPHQVDQENEEAS